MQPWLTLETKSKTNLTDTKMGGGVVLIYSGFFGGFFITDELKNTFEKSIVRRIAHNEHKHLTNVDSYRLTVMSDSAQLMFPQTVVRVLVIRFDTEDLIWCVEKHLTPTQCEQFILVKI